MEAKKQLIKTRVKPALIEETVEWSGPKKHTGTVWQVERYIWRTEDLPLYRVAVGEAMNSPFAHSRPQDVLQTRTLEYVPTGRIYYVNTPLQPETVLYEYRLKDAREARAGDVP